MARSDLHVRLDSEVKAEFKRICRRSGLTASQAVGVYAQEACRLKKLPVKLRGDMPGSHMSAERLRDTMIKLRSGAPTQYRLDLGRNRDV